MFQIDNKLYLVGKNTNKFNNLEPFNKQITDFFDYLSKIIFKDHKKSEYKDIIAIGFWFRKNNTNYLKKKFFEKHSKFPLGVIFHITPNNVPINFAYSLYFGLITGNTNIVKIPNKDYFQINYICSIIKKALKNKKFKDLRDMIKIIRYDNDHEITQKISKFSDARLIWGGDDTVNKVKNIIPKTKCNDLSFPDRYSMTLFNLNVINKIGNHEFNNLVKKFYIDNYTFDQNACNSSHLIFWLGNKRLSNIKMKFWRKLNSFLKNELFYPESVVSDKLNKLCTDILNFSNINKTFFNTKNLYVIDLKYLNKDTENQRGLRGYFYQYQSNNIKDLANIITKKYQTMAYYGFQRSFFDNFINKYKVKGIDRVVPIGRSMEMNYLWDGYDLLNSLTRVVDIK